MHRLITSLALTLSLSSCLGTQLAETEDRVLEALQVAQQETNTAIANGTLTPEKAEEIADNRDASIKQAWDSFEDAVESQVAALQGVGQTVAGAAVTGGQSLITQLLIGLGGALGGAGAIEARRRGRRKLVAEVNEERDARRKARNEPV